MLEKRFIARRYRKRRRPSPPVHFAPKQRTVWFDLRNKMVTGKYGCMENPCICGAREDVLIGEVDRHNLEVTTRLCKRCGLMRLDPILDPGSLIHFYKYEYRSLYEGEEFGSLDEEFEFRYHHQVGRAFDYVSRFIKEGRVLDYGCGGGWLVRYFADRGFDATGFDYDEVYTSFAREKGLKVLSGDERQLDKEEGYDLIILNNVFEHLADIGGFAGKMEGLLNRDGFAFIALPGLLGLGEKGIYANVLFRTLQNAHLWYFTLNTLRWVIESNSSLRLVEGDETIDSIFQKRDTAPFPSADLEGEYDRILAHIRNIEYGRYSHIKRLLDLFYLRDPLKSITTRAKK